MIMTRKLIYSDDYIATGLLILRVGIGIAFMVHGFPKLFGGHAAGLAGGLAKAGIPGGIVAAYLAGMAEFFGGLALIVGFLFRPATLAMAFTMAVAMYFHLSANAPFQEYSHALESLILFIALMVAGPGRFSLDFRWFCSSDEKACSPKSYSHSVPATF
jgi:putative oxidoreductase